MAKQRSLDQAGYITELLPGVEDEERSHLFRLSDQVRRCGDYLGFRHYFTIDELRLREGYFCQHDKLCAMCQLRRSSKILRTYSEKVAVLLNTRRDLTGCMVTPTVKDGPDLAERLGHLVAAQTFCLQRRGRALRGDGPDTEWARAVAGVSRVEIKRGENSGQWHPHIHSAWFVQDLPDELELRREWNSITGDSHQVKVSPFRHAVPGEVVQPELVALDLVECLKYAVKLSDTSPADALHIHEQTRGKKLLRPFGLLHGIELPAGCLDDPLTDTDLPYVEIAYRFHFRRGYLPESERVCPGERREHLPEIPSWAQPSRLRRRKLQASCC